MPKLFLLTISIFFLFLTTLQANINLEDNIQDFVLETKKIFIPDYPDAFNPSIIRWQGSLLLSFRTRHPSTRLANLIGFIRLNDNFQPISNPQLIEINKGHNQEGSYIQDPRLIVIDSKLYMIYSNLWKFSNTEAGRRVFIAEVQDNGIDFSLQHSQVFLDFDRDKKNKYEKNWVPFDYNGSLLLSYSLVPHKVFFPLIEEQRCINIALTTKSSSWKWGELRGGTPALVVDGQYLAFFHSSTIMKTTHSRGKPIIHYFMGAYTFNLHPPFALNKISPEPIIGKNFYEGPTHQTWKPLRVVFPCGFIFDEKYIWISYGRQDHEIWFVKLDKKKLLDSLVPVF